MPRLARLDPPGVLYHIIIRGIERGKIFRDDKDRDNLIDRLSILLPETQTACYAWAFMSNHAPLCETETENIPLTPISLYV